MALSLSQGAQLIASASFAARVRVAMERAAIAVSTEPIGSFTPTTWQKRRALALRILTGPDAMLPAFLAAVTADPNNSLSFFAPVLITSSTAANPSVVTTATHGLATNDIVEIAGHLLNTNINGTWPVTVLTATTFSVPQNGNAAGGATGTAQKMMVDSDIVFTVNSVYSAITDTTRTD